jgi:DNA-binding NarL/FixJ family response regulator
MQRTRVLIVDDHEMVVQALAFRLRADEQFRETQIATSGESALQLAEEMQPDLVLMDIQLPGWCAFDLSSQIRRRVRDVRILFVSGNVSDLSLHRAIALSASGIVLKGGSMTALLDAIRRAVAGERVYSPEILSRLEEDPATGEWRPKYKPSLAELSERQLQVLRYLAMGLSVKEIAARMFVSVKTVDSHKYRLMKLLKIHDRVELARLAIREGIADL